MTLSVLCMHLFYRDDVLCWLLLVRPFSGYFLSVLFCLLSMLISDSRFDLVWFRLSCDHGWIRSGSVNVRKQQQQQQQHTQPSHRKTPRPDFAVSRGPRLCVFLITAEAAHSMYVYMFVCIVITYSRVWINRVRLPILIVVS